MRVAPLEGATDLQQQAYRERIVGLLGSETGGAAATDEMVRTSVRKWDQLPATTVAADEAARRERTGSLVRSLFDAADANCTRYFADLGVNRRVYRSALTVGSSVVGAAGALASPERSAATLSGLAGLLSGVRGNLEEEIFANQGIPLLLTAMRTGRAARRKEYVDRLLPAQGAAPTATEVIDAARQYNGECTLNQAFAYANDQISE